MVFGLFAHAWRSLKDPLQVTLLMWLGMNDAANTLAYTLIG